MQPASITAPHNAAAKNNRFIVVKNFMVYFFANIIIKSKKIVYFALKLKKTISFAQILVV